MDPALGLLLARGECATRVETTHLRSLGRDPRCVRGKLDAG